MNGGQGIAYCGLLLVADTYVRQDFGHFDWLVAPRIHVIEDQNFM